MTEVADRPPPLQRSEPESRWADTAAVLLGVVMTMCACGYQFGHGDHDVYLLAPLHAAFPMLLAHDWFTTQTLQYHSVFDLFTTLLMRLHEVSRAFLLLYLALVMLLHAGWLALTRAVGGSRPAYLAGVVLWLMLSAGRSLAAYHMLQDSELLASNIASVLMLVGFAAWLGNRPIAAGVALGLSGLFHLDYAIAAVAGWVVLVGLQWAPTLPGHRADRVVVSRRSMWIGTAAVMTGSLVNIGMAIPGALSQKHGMPFGEFLDLYVRLRHPHHYDPRSWAGTLWLKFAWTIVPAVAVTSLWLTRPASVAVRFARQQAVVIYLGLAVAVVIGLIFAGWWFVSATLIQMSLSRFAVFLHLFGCTAGGLLLADLLRVRWLTRAALLASLGVVVSVIILGGFALDYQQALDNYLARQLIRDFLPARAGLSLLAFTPLALWATSFSTRRLRAVYPVIAVALLTLLAYKRNAWAGEFVRRDYSAGELQVCDWISNPINTPVDSIFLISPGDMIFTLHAQRAVVVNFKCPPQLTSEFPAYRDRLQDVLQMPSLLPLIGTGDGIWLELNRRFDSLPASSLRRIASKYRAGYVLLKHRLPDRDFGPPVYASDVFSTYVYRIPHMPSTKP